LNEAENLWLFFSFPVDEKKRNKEKTCKNNAAMHGTSRTTVILTRWRALIAAYANSQQILKQVQDDCKGWCMHLGPTTRNGL
jgi:hypothetical protein